MCRKYLNKKIYSLAQAKAMSRRTIILAPDAVEKTKVRLHVIPMPGNGRPKYAAIIDNQLYLSRGFQREHASHWATDTMAIANGQMLIMQLQDPQLLLLQILQICENLPEN